MSKISFLIAVLFILLNNMYSQNLYFENFDALQVGPVTLDTKGTTAGQGDFFVYDDTNAIGLNANKFRIDTYPNQGNILMVDATLIGDTLSDNSIQKRGFQTIINKRNTGNNVVLVMFDFFSGYNMSYDSKFANNKVEMNFTKNYTIGTASPNRLDLVKLDYTSDFGMLKLFVNDGNNLIDEDVNGNKSAVYFLSNSWYRIYIYFDYDNKKVVLSVPKVFFRSSYNFFNQSAVTNLISTHCLNEIEAKVVRDHKLVYPIFKLDNLKLIALDNTQLTNTKFLNESFSVYPNPTNGIITISNTENLQVEKVVVYDVSGKQVFASNSIINNQINIENFASGTYMLHIQTKQGTAVKKIVKP